MSYRDSLPVPFLRSIAALVCAAALAACGSSVNTSTSPSTISKCVVTFDTPAVPLPAGGGTGSLPVKAERECPWTAESSDAWLSITAGRSGQGNGTVEFAVAANADPVARTGGIMLNGSRAQVAQAASECRYTLTGNSTSLGQAGGTGSVDVRASSALCTWSAASDADWITITSGASGSGDGSVNFRVDATMGPVRTGALTIAGQTFTVQQASGCTYSLSPQDRSMPSTGGTGSFTVSTAGACPWTAIANAPWLAVTSGGGGTGTGTVDFRAVANTGGARNGTIAAGGQTFTVTQATACNPAVAPEAIAAPAAGGAQTVGVTAAGECPWTAVSHAAWVAVTAGASGSGNGSVRLDIQPNAGPARTATATIAGKTVGITQESGCTFSIAPAAQAAAVTGGSGSVAVTAGAGCTWTAVSNAAWITVTKGARGAGAGAVEFSVDANAKGAARTGTITIAGQTFTVEQGGT